MKISKEYISILKIKKNYMIKIELQDIHLKIKI